MFIDAELIAALIALTGLAVTGVYAFAKLGNRVDNLEREVKGLRQEVKELRELVLMALYGRGALPPHLPVVLPEPEGATDG